MNENNKTWMKVEMNGDTFLLGIENDTIVDAQGGGWGFLDNKADDTLSMLLHSGATISGAGDPNGEPL